MWPLTTTTITFLTMSLVLGGLEHRCNLEQINRGPSSGGICGENAHRVIQTLCMFYGKKRSVRDLGHGQHEALSPMILKRTAATAYLHSKRTNDFGRSGFTCECCYHRCTRGELLEYCN